jgi:flagellar basal-body rod protein FlgC
MSLFDIFNVAGSGMSAQSVRLNVVASNLANADNLSGSEAEAYRAKEPVFATLYAGATGEGGDNGNAGDGSASGVRVLSIEESAAPVQARYMPGNPLANKDGYVFSSNVNAIEEMVNMISASRSYQNNVEVMNTSKQMLLRTLSLGD